MSFNEKISYPIGGKQVQGGLPLANQVLQFNILTNQWEFVVLPVVPPSAPILYGTGNSVYDSLTTLNFMGFIEPDISTTVEERVQQGIPAAGIFRNSSIFIIANPNTVVGIITLRVNGVDTPLTMIVPVGFTGLVENTVDDVLVAAGDLISWSATQAVTATTNKNFMDIEFHPS